MKESNFTNNVLLEGTYGIGNFGDDLLWGLFKAKLQDIGYEVTVVGDLKLAKLNKIENIDIHRTDIINKFKAIAKAKTIVIGGGGQFNDNSSRSGGAHLVLTFVIAGVLGKPILVCGTGFGPLRKVFSRKVWRLLIQHTKSKFALREVKGVEDFIQLSGEEASLSYDPVFSSYAAEFLSIKHLTNLRNKYVNTSFGPGLLNFRSFRRNQYAEKVIAEELMAMGYALSGLSADNRGDLDFIEYKNFNIEEYHEYIDVPNLLTKIVNAPFVVTQRFHVLCVCYILGIPVIPVVYAEKMRDFCEWVNIPYITTEDQDPEVMRKTVRAAISASPVDFSKLSNRTDPLKWLELNLC